MAEKKAADRKVVKKKWYAILAPAMFNNAFLGECLVAEKNSLVGRTVSVNLMNLTGDARKQNISISFIVNSITDDDAQTEVIGYELNQSAVRRAVKRDAIKIDDSFICETADSKVLRIKPMIITVNKTGKKTLSSLRRALRESIKSDVKKLKYDDFVSSVVSNKLQVSVKKGLNKIYPLKISEIRSFKLIVKK